MLCIDEFNDAEIIIGKNSFNKGNAQSKSTLPTARANHFPHYFVLSRHYLNEINAVVEFLPFYTEGVLILPDDAVDSIGDDELSNIIVKIHVHDCRIFKREINGDAARKRIRIDGKGLDIF